MNIRPSALNMLDECPKFVGAPSEATAAGLVRHKALAEYLKGNENALDTIDDVSLASKENLLWAADYIKLKAPLQDFPLIVETKRKTVLPNGMPMEGTPDFVCGPEIFDLKWRYFHYTPQMAAYALMIISEGNFPIVTTHLLYGEPQTHRVLQFDAGSAWQIIKPIIQHVNEPFAAATPCEYCSWCAKKLSCESLIQQVNIAIESNPEWDLPQWHSSKMETPQEMGLALKIARTLSKWCESVEHHAKEMAVKKGKIPVGFKMSTRRGNRYITDVIEAFKKTALPQEEFLKTCSIRPRSLFDCYAEFHGMKKAGAEKEVMQKLGDTLQYYPTINMLQADKEKSKKD